MTSNGSDRMIIIHYILNQVTVIDNKIGTLIKSRRCETKILIHKKWQRENHKLTASYLIIKLDKYEIKQDVTHE